MGRRNREHDFAGPTINPNKAKQRRFYLPAIGLAPYGQVLPSARLHAGPHAVALRPPGRHSRTHLDTGSPRLTSLAEA